ncbi:transcriptional attenuator, LytR family [Streptomyces zhaozhouensis]|uniref:Transcriptional attenuator, LytR family n=1 Tax=Streptomyces zhaozhouensis TaxID=1300267 RepID=A0A286E0U5_9ACTN|nr:LCP family protein [Streptomyces zhaozhouensis]SOD64529.1 transcriptional attenuator, LytR family [Streptomyces zhaozhouensis]
MNDRQQPYGQIYGYDAYGRPLYHQPPQDQAGDQGTADHSGYGYGGGYGYQEHDYRGGGQGYQEPGYQDPGYQGQEGYGGTPSDHDQWGPYASDTGAQRPVPPAPDYGYQGPGHGYPQGTGQDTGPQPPVTGEWDTGRQAPVTEQGWDTGRQAPVAEQGWDTGRQAPVTEQGWDTGRQAPVAEQGWDTGRQAPVTEQGWDTGRQAPVVGEWDTGRQAPVEDTGQQAPVPPADTAPPRATVPEQRRASPDEAYETEQFSFVDEQSEESEDVIDWLKFSESRTERREEAKRRGRSRKRLLVVALVLALLGGVGFLWSTDRLPFLGGDAEEGAAGGGAEARDVIVVHLWPVDSEETSTALLVANDSAGSGTTLLLPNELAVTPDGGATTLGQAVADESAGSVRDAVGALLGAEIKGTWRLNTPSLANLVDLVSGITVATDTEVPGGEDDEGPLVEAGDEVRLAGQEAVAYATYRADEEPQSAQLVRFGQVMEAVLDKLPATDSGAVTAMENLRQIHDPSLSEQELGVSLATLAGYAQSGDYTTAPLPVEDDGTVSDETADGLVHEVLGGSVSNAQSGGAVRFGVRDASGTGALGEMARIALVGAGLTVVDNRVVDDTATESSILYEVPEHRETALDAARTLGLPEDVVTEGDGPGTADVTVVLGQDYEP